MDPFDYRCNPTARRQLRAAQCLRELENLPSLPQEQQCLLAMVRDPDVELDQLVEALERCPSVSARILSVARSAFFTQRTPAATVRDAVVRVLGLRLVADLVCCVVLRGPLVTDCCPAFDPQRYWCRSLLTAVLAQRFERVAPLKSESSGLSYLCGLLQGLGLLALVHLDPGGMGRAFAARAAGEFASLAAAEEELTGVTHGQIGGRLAEVWKLPRALAVVMSQPQATGYRGDYWELNRLVAGAGAAAERLMEDPDACPLDACEEAARVLGLAPGDEALEKEIDAARTQLEEIHALAAQFSEGER